MSKAELRAILRDVKTLSKKWVSYQPPYEEKCYFCGTLLKLEQVHYPYSVDFADNGSSMLELSLLLPGFHCASCDVDYLAAEVDATFEAIAKRLAELCGAVSTKRVNRVFTPLPHLLHATGSDELSEEVVG